MRNRKISHDMMNRSRVGIGTGNGYQLSWRRHEYVSAMDSNSFSEYSGLSFNSPEG